MSLNKLVQLAANTYYTKLSTSSRQYWYYIFPVFAWLEKKIQWSVTIDQGRNIKILHIHYKTDYLGKFTGGSKLPTRIPRSKSLSSNFFMKGWPWKYNEITRISIQEFLLSVDKLKKYELVN